MTTQEPRGAPQPVTRPLRPLLPSLGSRSVSPQNKDTRSNFCPPQVFLTVNSLAKVYWDGTFEKRRLELNWVNPPDVQRDDYVGLFRVDPQWFGVSSEILAVKPYPQILSPKTP